MRLAKRLRDNRDDRGGTSELAKSPGVFSVGLLGSLGAPMVGFWKTFIPPSKVSSLICLSLTHRSYLDILDEMEARILAPETVQEIFSSNVKSIPADEIDSTFKSNSTGK